jgi:uncharacterized membrane protein (Fun14 family)
LQPYIFFFNNFAATFKKIKVKTFLVGLFIVFLVWYAAKAVSRIFAIFLANKATSNKQSRKSTYGNVTIDITEQPKKRFEKNNGEYIDFEEVK